MFHMAGDSGSFLTMADLNSVGAYPTEDGRWRNARTTYERLYEGKMVQAFDHRAASIGFYARQHVSNRRERDYDRRALCRSELSFRPSLLC